MIFLQDASVQLATSQLWGEAPPSLPSLAPLLALLSPLHRERLPRTLASCLLYCGQQSDTVVAALPPGRLDTRLLLLHMSSFPGTAPPIGRTPGGRPCSRLAVLYHWAQPETDRQQQVVVRTNARKISASLALEKKMLSIVDVFAIFPCP